MFSLCSVGHLGAFSVAVAGAWIRMAGQCRHLLDRGRPWFVTVHEDWAQEEEAQAEHQGEEKDTDKGAN